MDDTSGRSEREGILFDPIEWDPYDEEVLKDSEVKLDWAADMYSKVLIDEMDAYSYFVAGMHNYINIMADYNNHARELSQTLFILFEASQRDVNQFNKLIGLSPEMLKNLTHDLKRWRTEMTQTDYSYDVIHKLHEPTMSAILQLIELVDPVATPNQDDDDDGLEFF